MLKLTETNQRTFKFLGHFLLFVIAPFLISGYLLEYPFVSAIVEKGLWYLVFAFIAGFFNAVGDTLSDHFSTSVFKNFNPHFWEKNTSAPGPKILGMRINAWHIAKMLHTLFLGLSVVYFVSTNRIVSGSVLFVLDFSFKVDFILWYGFYKWGFNLFYSSLLRK